MDFKSIADAEIESKSLLNHPFYQEWNEGTLPVHSLATYSAEYGAFIDTIAAGWDACGEPEIANEERDHAILWRAFASELGKDVGSAGIDQVKALVEGVTRFFQDEASAIGALYAFERQQPLTSQSKLKGLEEHYAESVGIKGREYFVVHLEDWSEPALLASKADSLSSEERERALKACSETCDLLWNALSGVHEA